MQSTGEQLVPGKSKARLVEEHFARYDFALHYTDHKRVLDIACGTGYGTSILAHKANKVVGVDISRDSIDFAKDQYHAENIEFMCASVVDISFDEGAFDVICSFETIEHLEATVRKQFLVNIRKWLKKDGVFILSTPNKRITSPFTDKPTNKFHVLEFTQDQLELELDPYFNIKECYGQRIIHKFLSYRLIYRMMQFIHLLVHHGIGYYTRANGLEVVSFDSGKYVPRIMVVVAYPHI